MSDTTREAPDGPVPEKARQHQYPCSSCGAALEFEPGTTSMTCPYCGSSTAITIAAGTKNDYATYAAATRTPLDQLAPATVTCDGCGATLTTTALSSRCPSCRGPLVVTDDLGGNLKTPDGIAPFTVDKAKADAEFRAWSGSRWFAPNSLKKVVKTDSMQGSYVPHWGFDDQTRSSYRGERGEHYWETEWVTVSDANGNSHQESRQVQKTRWFSASGQVAHDFVDVLVPAVTHPDVDHMRKLGPWSADQATAYESEFLAGFDTPRYTVPAESGLAKAKEWMADQIEQDVRHDIGGDEQRVDQVDTTDTNVLFRLLLMPLWIATYVVGGKTYHVYVNANTGKVIGERPYSTWKIALLVAAILVLVAVVVVAVKAAQSGG